MIRTWLKSVIREGGFFLVIGYRDVPGSYYNHVTFSIE